MFLIERRDSLNVFVGVCAFGISCAYFRVCVFAHVHCWAWVFSFFFIKCNVFIFAGTVMITKNFNIYSARSTTLSKMRDPEMLLLPGYPGHWL